MHVSSMIASPQVSGARVLKCLAPHSLIRERTHPIRVQRSLRLCSLVLRAARKGHWRVPKDAAGMCMHTGVSVYCKLVVLMSVTEDPHHSSGKRGNIV